MKKAENGLPEVESSAKGLGVRTGRPKHNDVTLTENGEVLPKGEGMSVASEWRKLKPWQVPCRLREKCEGAAGPDHLACFRLGDYRFAEQDLNADLAVRIDGVPHAVICARKQVPLHEFEDALADTRNDWTIDES